MPNRILKESICTSDSMNALTDFQENFFYRLIVNCDDFGRMDARPAILKARLYPLRERLALKDIEGALQALAAVGCVEIYEVDGKPFLWLPTWKVHQTVRATKSKYPAPEDGVKAIASNCKQLQADDFKCKRMQANAPVFVNEFENRIRESNSYSFSCPEPQSDSRPVAVQFPLNDGTLFPIYEDEVRKWEALYPAVDISQEIRNMLGWLDANPTKRKTKSGIRRFINSWLSKSQNSGGGKSGKSGKKMDGFRVDWAEIGREIDEENGGGL